MREATREIENVKPTMESKMKTETKPNIYIGPNAPKYVRDMLGEIFPDANDVSREEMDKKISEAFAAERTLRAKHPIYYQNFWIKGNVSPDLRGLVRDG
jgi:hypothetical protein